MHSYIQGLHEAKHNFLILLKKERRSFIVSLEINKNKTLRELQTRPAEQSNDSLRTLVPIVQ
jgi:hypothetical protein